MSASAAAEPLASRVADLKAGPARLLLCPAPVPDVVSFRGSFRTAPDLSATDDLRQALVADLLDKGTRRRDRFEIAELLEGRGAQLHLYADALRAGFAGRALREDLPLVLSLLAEQLREPAFPEEEFDKERRQSIAAVRRSMDSTAGQATGALTRRLYPDNHPNYVPPPEVELARLEAIAHGDVVAYHRDHFGSDALTIAFAGDIEPTGLARQVAEALGEWTPTGRSPAFASVAAPAPAGRVAVHIADRPNVDVRMGHAIDLRRDSVDWLAAHAGAFALGGNFSSRLMQIVRDEMGLTYGIGASVHNVAVEHDGHLLVHASLSADRLEEGLGATRAVIDAFASGGILPGELERVKSTLAGQHVVALATTGGLAARLLVNAERGFDVDYLDRFPDLVHSLTKPEVDAAIQRHIRPGNMHVAVAGSVV